VTEGEGGKGKREEGEGSGFGERGGTGGCDEGDLDGGNSVFGEDDEGGGCEGEVGEGGAEEEVAGVVELEALGIALESEGRADGTDDLQVEGAGERGVAKGDGVERGLVCGIVDVEGAGVGLPDDCGGDLAGNGNGVAGVERTGVRGGGGVDGGAGKFRVVGGVDGGGGAELVGVGEGDGGGGNSGEEEGNDGRGAEEEFVHGSFPQKIEVSHFCPAKAGRSSNCKNRAGGLTRQARGCRVVGLTQDDGGGEIVGGHLCVAGVCGWKSGERARGKYGG
jgi:hypothetical protein